MHNIPEALKILVEQISKLPGLGPKSAMRIAMTLLKWPEAQTAKLGKDIFELRNNLHLCQECGAISDCNPCSICSDGQRANDVLCLVSEWDSLLSLEEGGFYKGKYFILGGLLAPLENKPAEALEIDKLLAKLQRSNVQEIIFALGATAEAEATALFVREKIQNKFPKINITRLAQGIPLGAEVKFMDKETLRQSLQYRQNL